MNSIREMLMGSNLKGFDPDGQMTNFDSFKRMFYTAEGKSRAPSAAAIIRMSPQDQLVSHYMATQARDIKNRIKKSSEFIEHTKDMTPEQASGHLAAKVNIELVGKMEEFYKAIEKKKWTKSNVDETEAWIATFDRSTEERRSSSTSQAVQETGASGKKWGDLDQEEEKVFETTNPAALTEDQPQTEQTPAFFGTLTSDTINRMSYDDLISVLAEGLEYDKFEPARMRDQLVSLRIKPNELVTLLTAYVFIGNNPMKLTNKVRTESVGKAALSIVNKYNVIRRKQDSKSLTLSRIAIAFSPAVYAIRTKLESERKLPTSGILTTTPLVLQDVALSGVSDRIPFGEQMKDYLIKFNRALTKFSEKNSREKSSEIEMDSNAEKFLELSINGAKSDTLVQDWDFKNRTGTSGLKAFIDKVFGLEY